MTVLKAGFYGYPLNKSKAPRLYRFWIKKYGIAGTYDPISVGPEAFEETLRKHVADGWRGGSITMPHKEIALTLADDVSDRARAIGATNTVIFRDGRIVADNYDGVGFLTNLKHEAGEQFDPAAPALVFGAGGAARAVLHALLDAGVPEIRLANRSRERAESLAKRFGRQIQVIEWTAAEEAMPGAATVINTTSLGMVGNPPLPFSLDRVDAGAVVADIVSRPAVTPLLAAAQARGLTTVGGLGMLLHQAPSGFAAWFGVRPEVDRDVWDVMTAP